MLVHETPFHEPDQLSPIVSISPINLTIISLRTVTQKTKAFFSEIKITHDIAHNALQENLTGSFLQKVCSI